jgi:hypothetical protein
MHQDKSPGRVLLNQPKPCEWVDDLLDAISERCYNRYTVVGPRWLLWLGIVSLILEAIALLFPKPVPWVLIGKPACVGASLGLVLIGWLSYRLRARWQERPGFRERGPL